MSLRLCAFAFKKKPLRTSSITMTQMKKQSKIRLVSYNERMTKEYQRFEDKYSQKEQREKKIQRKLSAHRDLGKRKKTDHDKLHKDRDDRTEKRLDKDDTLEGHVIAMGSEGIMIEHEGKNYLCVLRGILKKEKTEKKSLITIGDLVSFIATAENEGAITKIAPRKSILSRADALQQKKEHLIAANIDQVLITASVVNPTLKPSLIDRYIISAIKGGMQPIIIINKVDLLEKDSVEELFYQELLKAYSKTSIPIISLSASQGTGIDRLIEIMKGKTSVFSGQSGVGKSSLINVVADLKLKIGSTIEKTKKGSHTTTQAQLVPLKFGGWCIDTPGIKSFGVWDVEPHQLKNYYEEMVALSKKCHYPDCSHTHEPHCAIIAALDKKIHRLRYENYLSILSTLEEEQRRR